MCRHLAYLGPPARLADLLLEPPHSLLRQSWAPVDMRHGGTVNADGFGVGWYPTAGRSAEAARVPDDPAGRAEPVRYRRSVPIWADEALPGIMRATHAQAVLAAVRSGTPGMPVVETACAPFADGRWLFSHNGVVAGWPGSVAKLAERLPVTDLMTLDAPTDSAVLWALLRGRLRTGQAAADAVRAVTADVVTAAPLSRLNLLLTDGELIVATAWTHSLWVRRELTSAGASVAVSSEPWDPDDGQWQPVPDRRLVVATRDSLDLYPMEGRL